MKNLWTFEQLIPKPVSKTREIIFKISEGNFTANNLPFILKGSNYPKVEIQKENNSFTVLFPEGNRQTITLDIGHDTIAIQGEWWYCGEYKLQESGRETLIIHTVYNVAKTMGWIAAWMNRGQKKNHEAGFRQFVNRLLAELK